MTSPGGKDNWQSGTISNILTNKKYKGADKCKTPHITKLEQEEYMKRYEGLVSRFEVAKARFNEISEHQQEIKVRREKIEAFLCTLREQDELITEFDERLWHTLVDTVTVFSESNIRFTFKDGSEF